MVKTLSCGCVGWHWSDAANDEGHHYDNYAIADASRSDDDDDDDDDHGYDHGDSDNNGHSPDSNQQHKRRWG